MGFMKSIISAAANWVRKVTGHKCICTRCGSHFVATECLDLCMSCKVADLLEYADKIIEEHSQVHQQYKSEPKSIDDFISKNISEVEEDEDTHRPEDY